MYASRINVLLREGIRWDQHFELAVYDAPCNRAVLALQNSKLKAILQDHLSKLQHEYTAVVAILLARSIDANRLHLVLCICWCSLLLRIGALGVFPFELKESSKSGKLDIRRVMHELSSAIRIPFQVTDNNAPPVVASQRVQHCNARACVILCRLAHR